ncbi:MAG TPA: lysophospholipid acyltransferase family protein [Mucilaginibacter sp.]|nr:lysophospholipid acyltransferase family protein [Mucilaginibacter sp.]
MINKGLSYVGLFFLYLVSLLPFWLLYLLSDLLFIIIYYLIRYRRDVVMENLRNAFPERSDQERRTIQRRFYRFLADLIVETIKLFTISEKTLARHIKGLNTELAIGALTKGRSIVGAVGHYGNWEIAALELSTLVTNPKIIVYKPLTNETFDKSFKKMRSRFGATLVSMKNAVRTIAKHRHEAVFSVLVSDQTPVREDSKYFINFLNQPTAIFLGIEKMAKMTDAMVVFCDLRRVKRGYYEYRFIPLFDNPKNTADYEITRAHVEYLEKVIREEPAYWLWSHKRWKFKPGDIGVNGVNIP